MSHLPQPLLEVLMGRGIRDVDEFLRRPSLNDLEKINELDGISEARERVLRAITSGEPIVLFGDYDCDGILGTAIIYGVLKKLGARVQAYIPHRDEGYGFNVSAALRFARMGYGLIITIDNGIHASRAIALARRLGMDVIVIDHHRRTEEVQATVLWSELFSGASLACLFAADLLRPRSWNDLETILRSLLSFAAVAAIADCVPLIGQQRLLVRIGLQELANSRNPGLRKLLATAGVREGEIPTAQDIAFGVAPRINAAGRMAHPKLALQMLCAATDSEAAKAVATLNALNQKRKQREREILPAIFGQYVPEIGGLVFYKSEWPKGIAGILAARAAEHFHRPAIVLVRDSVTGELTGSGRSIEGIDLHQAIMQCAHLLTRFGGHSQAIGLSLNEQSLNGFREAFRDATALCGKTPRKAPRAEAYLNLASVSSQFWHSCRALEPFGIGFPPFVFWVSNAQIEVIRLGRARLKQGPHRIELSVASGLPVEDGHGTFLIEITGRGARLLNRVIPAP